MRWCWCPDFLHAGFGRWGARLVFASPFVGMVFGGWLGGGSGQYLWELAEDSSQA